MTNQPGFRRLERIEVDGLFGIYNHRIDLRLHDHVTLLHGPNGVGKTVVLRMIDALLKGHLSYFRKIPFFRLLIVFHDGSRVELLKEDSDQEEEYESRSMLTLSANGKETSSPVRLRTDADRVGESISHLQPHPTMPEVWIDTRDGELLSSPEMIARYRDHVTLSRSERFGSEELSWFHAFLESANTHLVEAQRLFQFGQDYRPRQRQSWRSRSVALVSTVVEYGQDFRTRLAQSMAAYGRQSQTLDQSFPQRLITAQDMLSADMLESRIAELEEKTSELKKIGILEETRVPPIHAGTLENIDPTQARVMTLYVQDTTAKLATLDDLKDRSRFLLNSVNDKYRHKRIRLDSEHGLVAESDDDEPLALDSLSSGEQHELVLHYDLLFKVPSNTIVLVDEPELSLHVSWQKRFLRDLLEIVKLSGFDALVATHSPYIIGDRTDLMIGLGDVT